MLVTALLGCNSQTKLFTHLKCTIQCILVNSQSWATISTISFRTFPSPPKETPYLSAVTPHLPSTPSTLSPVTFCVWLLSLSKMFSRFTTCSMYQYFIPFYGWIMLYSMDRLYFIYPGSSVDGRLRFFYFLAIMNSFMWAITFSLKQTLSVIII